MQALWGEFGKALETADQILVLGHSLNDPVLIEALAQYARRNRLAVALDFPHDHAEAESAVHEKLPGAAVVEMHMGPQVTIGPRFGEAEGRAPRKLTAVRSRAERLPRDVRMRGAKNETGHSRRIAAGFEDVSERAAQKSALARLLIRRRPPMRGGSLTE